MTTKNIEIIKPTHFNRVFTLSVVGMMTLLMFGLALTARADTLTRQLEQGMSGADVSSLQVFLAKDSTIYPQGLVTGFFGLMTKTAVSNFQTRNGIASVGRVGPVTLSVINQQMNGDNSAPVISSLNVSTTNSSVTMNWYTSENAAAIIYYSTSPISMLEGSPTSAVTIGGSSFLVHTDLRSVHSATLIGLQSNTVYYYVVYVRDGSGNENITWPSTFQTN